MGDLLDWIMAAAGENVLAGSAALVFLAVATLTLAVAGVVQVRGDIRRRAAGVNPEGGDAASPGQGSPSRRSRAATEQLLDYVTRNFVPSDPRSMRTLRRQLMQAGFLQASAVPCFFIARVVAATALAAAAGLLVPGILSEISAASLWLLTGGAGVTGYCLPSMYLTRRARRLQDEHRTGFPDFMDLMVVCADAGLSMEAAIDRVGRELAESYPSLSANLYMATLEVRAGRTLGEALEHLGDRLGIEESRSFATLLQQSEELGSSLTEALRVYSGDMRHQRLSRAEEKAYSLPAKLVLPLGVFIFPVLFIAILLPVVIRVKANF